MSKRGRPVSSKFLEALHDNPKSLYNEYLQAKGKDGRNKFCRKYQIHEPTMYKYLGKKLHRSSSLNKEHVKEMNDLIVVYGNIKEAKQIIFDEGISALEKRITHTYDMTGINK